MEDNDSLHPAVDPRRRTFDAYDTDFYADQAAGSLSSARVVLPLVFDHFPHASVLDVGCGRGTWLAASIELGTERVFGIDGSHVDPGSLLIDRSSFLAADLSAGVPDLSARYDIALSLEVAEHLQPETGKNLVRDLCAAADVVLFSAAIPGQLGTGHINCQPQSAWVSAFVEHDFTAFDVIRPAVWTDSRVEVWYRQNTLLFVANDQPGLIETANSLVRPAQTPLDLVHPEHHSFWVRRATREVSLREAGGLAVRAANRGGRRRLAMLRRRTRP